jgi:TonB family protein
VIRFDFDDRYRDQPVDETMPWFVRVLIADAAFYVLFAFILGPWMALLVLLWPKPAPEQVKVERDPEPLVFMQPSEIPRELLRPRPIAPAPAPAPAPKPPDRIVLPGNTRPFEAGNPPAPQPQKAPEPEPAPQPPPRPEPEAQIARNTAEPPQITRPEEPSRSVGGTALGRALKNLDQYAQNQTQANPLGGATDPEAAIQFDNKGINFDPWLRRFVSQVRRNWFVPLSAMNFKGRVVLQFNIHRNGRITEVHVAQPSDIESFNRAAYNAILGSNPTEPLPAGFPDEIAPFTVTFFYNERPGG